MLEKNVRSFLQFKGANKGIRDTIREEPEKFIAYNNGLTITASDIKLTTDKKDKGRIVIESLTDLQIVNGGQTTASIYFSRKEGIDISKVMVMAKINVINQNKPNDLDDLVSKISRFSNTQSRVSNVDIRSRSPQLVAIKQLSESVTTPTRRKWFFDRVKGDFNTKVKLAGSKATQIKKDFPPAMRFSKEQLAKCYCSWGASPYLVKKGGEKIFRQLMESLNGNESTSSLTIDREFYEELIAKIIMFRRLEKIYGQGPYAIGQIRAATVPYAIATLYSQFSENNFDFSSIWNLQALPDDLDSFFGTLLNLINDLIKKYSKSDDLGEYSKKLELWESVVNSKEIGEFYSKVNNQEIIFKYTKK
nr:AIPR family protein [Psychromonas sp. SA13A]